MGSSFRQDTFAMPAYRSNSPGAAPAGTNSTSRRTFLAGLAGAATYRLDHDPLRLGGGVFGHFCTASVRVAAAALGQGHGVYIFNAKLGDPVGDRVGQWRAIAHRVGRRVIDHSGAVPAAAK